ncbi:flavin reductase family protein [Hornefia butyriciproducens]|uniref:flavin reductase family protein n=1 Tax=Hornefia butyriciproducens TaxID=2652293 RepID=UPI003F8CDAA3
MMQKSKSSRNPRKAKKPKGSPTLKEPQGSQVPKKSTARQDSRDTRTDRVVRKVTMKPGTMLNPVPVVLVSCAADGKQNLITIAWTGIVNSEPPMTYISVRKSRYSHELIRRSGEFVINLATESIAEKVDFCGVRSGRDVDKFAECGFTPVPSDQVSAPLVAESPVNLECVVRDVIEYPSHDMFVAEIVCVHGNKNLFGETGRFCLEEAGLIAYSHGEYFGLKPRPLGRFGYSVMKPKTCRRIRREQRNSRKRR